MPDPRASEEALRRSLVRDDLLRLAAGADRAVSMVGRRRGELALAGDVNLFDHAFQRHLDLARDGTDPGARRLARDHAAILLCYCARVRHPIDTPLTPADIYAEALAELVDSSTAPGLDRLDNDPTLGVIIRYHAARDLRLAGDFAAARELARRSPQDLFGTGAEAQIAHYLYELGAGFISQGHAADVRHQYEELRQYFDKTRARGFSTNYRFALIQGLVAWAVDPADPTAGQYLDHAVKLLDTRTPAPTELAASGQVAEPVKVVAPEEGEDSRSIREVSVLLTAAEYLVATEAGADDRAVDLAQQALAAADGMRARWRVVARSRAPLAEVFQRIYGDLAALADRIGGERAAELGLKTALSAKATGFAVRIRDGITFDENPLVSSLMTAIDAVENPASGPMTDSVASRHNQLAALARELAEAVSPMLADTVFPAAIDLDELRGKVALRHALDFVELTDSLDSTAMFRSWIEPDGRISFDRLDAGTEFSQLVTQWRARGDLVRSLDRAAAEATGPVRGAELPGREVMIPGLEERRRSGGLDLRALAQQILPVRLLEKVLPSATNGAPIRLLVSAHSWLSLVPWAGLVIDDQGHRLVERAVLSHCPVLSCLTGDQPSPMTGAAIIRLVGEERPLPDQIAPTHGVDVREERIAWGLPDSADGVLLSSCDLDPSATPLPFDGRFDTALATRGRWQFLHIAAHGSGSGLDQELEIPGESLSAARALGLRWPSAVLMASCHVGLVVNSHQAEPLGMVTAVLTGGATCVVAGIDSVDDAGTGRLAGAVVRAVRHQKLSLEDALRQAQLVEVLNGQPERNWALLQAYAR